MMCSDSSLSRQRALPVWTAETLHGSWTLVDSRTDGLELSLKLYHARELQLGYQQSIDGSTRKDIYCDQASIDQRLESATDHPDFLVDGQRHEADRLGGRHKDPKGPEGLVIGSAGTLVSTLRTK